MYTIYLIIIPCETGFSQILNEIENKKYDTINDVNTLIKEKTGLNSSQIEIWSLPDWMDHVNTLSEAYNLNDVYTGYVQIKASIINHQMINDAKQTLKNGGYIDAFLNTDDVVSRAEDIDVEITSDQAQLVVDYLGINHDCNHGIDWDTISNAIEEILRISKKGMWETKNGVTNIIMPTGKLVTVRKDLDQQLTEIETFINTDSANKKYYTTLLERFKAYQASLNK